jgi:holliday junction DNA helicase RuvA
LGAEVTLRTHLIVREDAHILFAFSTQQECQLFQEIIKINGVGPKLALTILSGLSPHEFAEIITLQDVARLQRLPGIGSKTAQRMLVEMQDKLAKLNLTQMKPGGYQDNPARATDTGQEAIAALVSLGYKPAEATKAIQKISQKDVSVELMIKEALQGLSKI